MMSKLMHQMLKQCRRPTGWLGRLAAWSMNRGHAQMTIWGLAQMPIEKDDTILDVGCGGGATVRRLAAIATEGKVYGVDLSGQSVAVARETNRPLIRAGRVEIQPGSVSHLPFPDGKFDLVTAVETYYFWPDLIADLREVLRVLKPGGRLAVVIEAYKGGKYEERNRQWVELGNMAYHSSDELANLFSTAGYVNVQVFEEYEEGWLCCTGKKARVE